VSSAFRTNGEPLHFATLWEAIADEIPSAPALTHGARTVAWGEFEQRAARLAGALRAHGLGPGSVVACYLYNCPEYFETFLAALKIRAVPANVNYRYGGAELRALLENCEAEALFFDSALRERVASVRHDLPWIRLLVEVGEAAPAAPLPGACGYEKLISSSAPAPRVSRSEQDVFLSYTGGTTGLPKGVRYTIAAVWRTPLGCANCSSARAPSSGSWSTRPSRHATAIAWSPSRRRRSCTAPGSPSPRSPR